MAGKGPASKTLNSKSHVNYISPTCSFTTLDTGVVVPSVSKQFTWQERRECGSPVNARYSTTSERTQENCAPVSIIAGIFLSLRDNLTHNNGRAVFATTFRRAITVPARWFGDLRALARFPDEKYSPGNNVCAPFGHMSNI